MYCWTRADFNSRYQSSFTDPATTGKDDDEIWSSWVWFVVAVVVSCALEFAYGEIWKDLNAGKIQSVVFKPYHLVYLINCSICLNTVK